MMDLHMQNNCKWVGMASQVYPQNGGMAKSTGKVHSEPSTKDWLY